MTNPELITILEGPTPEFRPSGQDLFQSIVEGPADAAITICEMRTANGVDIQDRCRRAWHEGRPVKLDFPDEMRLRRQVDVVAMRLDEIDEGTVLVLWARWPMTDDDGEDSPFDEEEFDDGDEGAGL